MAFIELKDVTKIYGKEDYKTVALSGINLEIEKGEFVSIMGPSGSGKTTLLNIIGCMDVLTQGEYILDKKSISKNSENQLAEIRGSFISFIFQNFALMNDYTVYENIELPLHYKKISKKNKRTKILDSMKMLGISDLSNKRPTQISGGQQQRVAIARALVCDAEIILADEPTGSLDQKNGEELLNILGEINSQGKTIIIITHDQNVANYTKRNINIIDGKIS